MTEPWNVYGDVRIDTTGAHGADIASQRLDDLDRRAVAEVVRRTTGPCTTVDLGGGFGWQSIRFALLGADAHVFDLLPEPPLVATLRSAARLRIAYHPGDLTMLMPDHLPDVVHVGYSQRFVHYLPFAQAATVLTQVAGRMAPGSPFFISASGLDSELGDGYDGRDQPVNERCGPLRADRRQAHGIHEPVCLYHQDDLTRLMTRAGFVPDAIWRSPFGNVKGIFLRKNDAP